ncbi:MAG: hypothetical protein GWP06_06255 [Actinobacteria bacterium]|nr:hypothetical protein [Actinomycetota bacterium]
MKKIFNLLSTLIFILSAVSISQKISGNIHTEYSSAKKAQSRFFENWTDISLSRGGFRLGGRFSFHEPPASFSQQDTTWGLAQRFLEYKRGGLNIRVGNFYSLLGRGLVLRSFDNRTLRWDSNIDGLKADYHSQVVDAKILAGRPRKTRLDVAELKKSKARAAGETLPAIYGGEIRLKPYTMLHLGGTYLYTAADAQQTQGFQRGSFFGKLYFDFASLYGEYAVLPYPESYHLQDGKAVYVASDLFLGDLSITGEFKSYKNFAFYDGLLNNPPTVTREHLFTLLNRHQLVQNANDEKGFLVEMNYPVAENGVATAGYCITRDSLQNTVYQEWYGQFEMDEFLGGEWLWAAGRQKEYTRRYLNFVADATYELTDYYSIKVIYEHLHARDEATQPDRMYYDQLITIGLSKAPKWTLSFLGEHSTDQTMDEHYVPGHAETKHFYWAGGQLDVNVYKNFDLSVFAGTRRQGKICIGGVCVVKPELQGVEVTLIGRF